MARYFLPPLEMTGLRYLMTWNSSNAAVWHQILADASSMQVTNTTIVGWMNDMWLPADCELYALSTFGSFVTLGARLPETARVYRQISSSGGATFREYFDQGYSCRFVASIAEYTGIHLYSGSTLIARTGLSYSMPTSARFRLTGTTLQAKVWSGSTEPSNWQLSVTNSAYTSGGYWGLITSAGGSVNFYCLGIGTGGDSAPTASASLVVSGTVTLNGNPVAGAHVEFVKYGIMGRTFAGSNRANAITDSNGNYSVTLHTPYDGPWMICAAAVINGVYYASDARLISF